ncbi:hypothetical protein OnM2_056003 [Erysiphe neolycopersici]|uniref:GAR domain-containing protein n=1 Tax=Erysiphe neolycopersici TaxID=212602 RepID=A0A420HR28_9PEZI|nr:hypothetical protein OnM2_056003 [Erysiphe neolycopersici]
MIMDQEYSATVLPRIIQPLQKQNPSRPFTLQRALSNDILFDLDPSRTLEALTSSSGSLSTVNEDVTPSERAFGIRAVIACKSIKEWLEELTNWTWPKTEGLTGFEKSPTNERGLPTSHETLDEAADLNSGPYLKYIGCLTESQISMYESRINQISDAMEDLRVDEIKRQVLDTHFSSKSRPSSSCSSVPLSKFLSLESYSKINDFTAIITASILQALPRLSKLVRLMEIWRVRICVLWKMPAFFVALEDTEIALKSGWNAIKNIENGTDIEICTKSKVISRETFDVIRYILQEKVMTLGQRLDFMLNMLEGSQDTIPDSWLARMEDIEEDYGEWVVAGERQVRRGQWLTDTEVGSVDKIEETKIERISSSTSEQEALRAIKQPLLYSTEIADSENISELKIPEATRKSIERLAESKNFPTDMMSEISKSHSTIEMNSTETDVGKRSQERYEISKELSSLKQKHLRLYTSILTVEKIDKDIEESNESQISESLTSASIRKKQLTVPDKKDYYFEQPEQLELNSSGKISSSTLGSNQSEIDFDSENIIKTLSHDITDIVDSQTRDSRFSSPLQTYSSKNKESNVACRPMALEVSEDKRLYLDGSSDCFEKPDSNFSEVDELQNLSRTSNHVIDERCSLASNVNGNVTNDSISHKSVNRKRIFVDEIDDIDFSDATERNEKKSVDCSKKSIITPNSHPTFDGNFEGISSTELIKTHLNCQAKNDYPTNSSIKNVVEPYDISKESYVSLPVFCTDGSSESCFATSYKSKNRDIKNSSGTKLSSKLYHRKRSISLPSEILNSIVPSEANPKASKASITHSAHPSLELRKHMEPHNTINMVPSSVDVFFLDKAGLEYTLKVPLDGKITYTNNNLIISNICSSIDISALCIVTLEGCVPSLALGFPGNYSVIPPQPIFSVYYRGIAPNVIQNSPPKLDFNSVLETNRHETASITAYSNEFVAKAYSHAWKLPSPTVYPVFMEKSSSPPNASSGDSLCQDIDLGPNCNNYQNISIPDNKNIPPSNYDTLEHHLTHDYSGMQLSYPKASTEISDNTSPSLNGSPASDKTVIRPLFQKDEQFSLSGQIDFMRDISFDVTPPDSPLLRTQKCRSISFGSHSLKPLTPLLESTQQKTNSSSPAKTESLGIAKGNKNDQFQRQISSLLKTMPSLIYLTPQSEPKTLNSQSVRPKGSRRSLTPHSQTTSLPNNFSNSQTSTPLYTLVPANAKVTARSKHHNNSEIRIYHLSRSNGEAPIKLFVRLVGEHGERVMVRVGGGWADLGEYLREFASHHGRLTVTDTVRIHEAPTRKSSANTLRSSSVCREGEYSSPYPRPRSVIEQRPRSSLEIPKTRRSTGMSNLGFLENCSRNSMSRCPSTPVPNTKVNNFETPPSGTSSNGTVASTSITSDRSSRMSWNEEDFNLGLAGPRSKKMSISERDQEWIESMKEKVRMASAEKDRRNRERTEKSRNRGLSLDGLDKVGGTRRFFRRDGSVV